MIKNMKTNSKPTKYWMKKMNLKKKQYSKNSMLKDETWEKKKYKTCAWTWIITPKKKILAL